MVEAGMLEAQEQRRHCQQKGMSVTFYGKGSENTGVSPGVNFWSRMTEDKSQGVDVWFLLSNGL